MDCQFPFPEDLPDPGIEPRSPVLQADSLPFELQWKVKVKLPSHVWIFKILWTVAYQGPLSMGFSRQEYWTELPFPSPEDLPDPGIKPRSPILQADALPPEPPGKPKGSKSHSSLIVKEQGLQNQTELVQIPIPSFVTSDKWTQLSKPSFLHVKTGFPAAGTSHNAAPQKRKADRWESAPILRPWPPSLDFFYVREWALMF